MDNFVAANVAAAIHAGPNNGSIHIEQAVYNYNPRDEQNPFPTVTKPYDALSQIIEAHFQSRSSFVSCDIHIQTNIHVPPYLSPESV
ncbi:hypothetical protein WICPIJ_002295 [Wickerhamomyces pijperi]|uniref:Uncharacterized protein n=1 Tax=Wickerhamomyces pijperi TaxID=599730 RepID=A0A9P8TPT4_WICPI|nr:hypothetical protein WICPIJ_002295 [Wickerhamomyces pijperi]